MGKYYSVNESNFARWDKGVQTAVRGFHGDLPEYIAGKNSRYIGSLVADFHRNLIAGGIFMYPADKKNPNGKLRLLYECAPMAFIAEQAGGAATDGERRILDLVPESLHERSPLVIGSRDDVAVRRRHHLAACGTAAPVQAVGEAREPPGIRTRSRPSYLLRWRLTLVIGHAISSTWLPLPARCPESEKALPRPAQAHEVEAWGAPTFRVKNKLFAMYAGRKSSPRRAARDLGEGRAGQPAIDDRPRHRDDSSARPTWGQAAGSGCCSTAA